MSKPLADQSGNRNTPLFSLVAKVAPALGLALLMSLGISLCTLIPPVYMINIFDKVMYSHSLSTLLGISIAAMIGLILFVALDYLRLKLFILLGSWLGRQLSDDLLESALSQSLRGRGSASDTVRDIGELRQFFSNGTLSHGLEFFWSPIFYLVLYFLHPVFALMALIATLVMVGMAAVNEVLLRKKMAEVKRASMAAYSDLGDALRNAEVIEGMGLMRPMLRRWRMANDRTLRLGEEIEAKAGGIRSISKGIQLVQSMAFIGGGAVLAIQGATTTGAVFAAMIIGVRALQPIHSLIGSWRQWAGAVMAANRLADLAEDHELQKSRGSMALPRPTGRLTVERLIYAVPGIPQPILRNVNFTAQPGQLTAVIGPSAAGKSTLAKLLVGVWSPTAGSVRLDGNDVFLWDRQDFGQYVGYLPQQVELFTGTVRENIARLTDAPAPRVIEAAKRAGAHGMIAQLAHGYDTDVGTFGQRLTGGQRQRIGLARALFGNPALLVLDEPDASLDTEGQTALIESLETARAAGTTIVVISHRPGLIRMADQIVVMRQGAVERIVGPDSLTFDENGVVGVNQRVGQAIAQTRSAVQR